MKKKNKIIFDYTSIHKIALHLDHTFIEESLRKGAIYKIYHDPIKQYFILEKEY